jgi:hypothetical protein
MRFTVKKYRASVSFGRKLAFFDKTEGLNFEPKFKFFYNP